MKPAIEAFNNRDGVERSRPAENLGAAIGRGSKPAAEGLGRTGGLAAAAPAYELR